jgi:hypothetical protein
MSEGSLKNTEGNVTIVNSTMNVLLEGEKLPEITILRADKRINIDVSHEVKLLRPVWIVVTDIGETDIRNLNISDKNGNPVHSFKLDANGNLSISVNYLRNLVIRLTAPEVKLLPDIKNDIEFTSIMSFTLKGIVQGNPNGNFDPQAALNRAATSKLIALLIGLQADKEKAGDDWFSALQRALVNAGIIKGSVSAETIELRANFLALVAKAQGININTLPACEKETFTDVPKDVWFCPLVEYAKENGWLRETSGEFAPDAVVTRSWAVGVLDRAFQQTITNTISTH